MVDSAEVSSVRLSADSHFFDFVFFFFFLRGLGTGAAWSRRCLSTCNEKFDGSNLARA
jgi:hypothetical protein